MRFVVSLETTNIAVEDPEFTCRGATQTFYVVATSRSGGQIQPVLPVKICVTCALCGHAGGAGYRAVEKCRSTRNGLGSEEIENKATSSGLAAYDPSVLP